MTNIVFTTGLILGALCIMSVLYRFVFRNEFELKEISIIVFGVALIALSVFTTGKFSVSPTGGIEASFESSLGVSKADTNAAIKALSGRIDTIDQSITALTKSTPAAASEIATIRADDKPNADFVENSRFTVIVFFKDAQKELAGRLVDKLLNMGFKSSAVKTDLTEAKIQYPSGTAWLVWEQGAGGIKEKLKSAINQISPGTSVQIRPEPYDLFRGDVQILLF